MHRISTTVLKTTGEDASNMRSVLLVAQRRYNTKQNSHKHQGQLCHALEQPMYRCHVPHSSFEKATFANVLNCSAAIV